MQNHKRSSGRWPSQIPAWSLTALLAMSVPHGLSSQALAWDGLGLLSTCFRSSRAGALRGVLALLGVASGSTSEEGVRTHRWQSLFQSPCCQRGCALSALSLRKHSEEGGESLNQDRSPAAHQSAILQKELSSEAESPGRHFLTVLKVCSPQSSCFQGSGEASPLTFGWFLSQPLLP